MPSGDMYQIEDIDDRLDDFGWDILDQRGCHGCHGMAWNFCSLCYTTVSRRAVPTSRKVLALKAPDLSS